MSLICAAEVDPQRFRIERVHYSTDGSTRENALEKSLSWDYERVFNNRYELEAYIQSKKNFLINKKIYKLVHISYEKTYEDSYFVSVQIQVKLEESWTILPLPIYKYDDNLGLVMGMGLDYKNVLGSLSDFKTSYYYSQVKSEYRADWENVRAGPFLMDFKFNQLWETVKSADSSGNTNLIYDYMESVLRVSLMFPLTDKFSYYTRPIIQLPYGYDFLMNDTGNENSFYSRSGVIPAYNHLLEWDGINWIGNLRQGLEASIENQIDFDIDAGKMVLWVDGMFKSHIYTPYFNYSSRVSSFYYYNDIKLNAADRLRGVLDFKLSGNTGVFWNQSFPINVVEIKKAGQLQLVPFADMGFVLEEGQKLSSRDIQYTSGLSLVVFPSFLPSFSLSIDYGINLRDFSERELRIDSQLYF
ncbi:MAG: hypothetical protein PQJ58_16075 [Spirochaetales bacterium]|nr:hypothetical protein [Spirochaetales bacterium]